MFKTRQDATAAGKRVKERLDARWPKWKLRVWSNLGWYYDLRHGPISLSPSCGTGFKCLVSESMESDGTGGRWPEFPHHGETPEAAVIATTDGFQTAVTSHVLMMLKMLDAILKGEVK